MKKIIIIREKNLFLKWIDFEEILYNVNDDSDCLSDDDDKAGDDNDGNDSNNDDNNYNKNKHNNIDEVSNYDIDRKRYDNNNHYDVNRYNNIDKDG